MKKLIAVILMMTSISAFAVLDADTTVLGDAKLTKRVLGFTPAQCNQALVFRSGYPAWVCQLSYNMADLPQPYFALDSKPKLVHNLAVTYRYRLPNGRVISNSLNCSITFTAFPHMMEAAVKKVRRTDPEISVMDARHCISRAYQQLNLATNPITLHLITL